MEERASLSHDDDEIVKIISSDDSPFETTVGAVKRALTIRNLIADCDLENPIPLPNIKGEILEKVLQYLKHLAENPGPVTGRDDEVAEGAQQQVSPWDVDFCAQQSQADLFELILAANYLDIKELLDVTCKSVANMIKGKTTEEIRATFNIINDLTPEEEEQIRKENAWCEER